MKKQSNLKLMWFTVNRNCNFRCSWCYAASCEYYVDDEMTSKRLSLLVDELIMHYGVDDTPSILDKIKDFGFKYSTFSGTTWGLDNVKIPKEKKPGIS